MARRIICTRYSLKNGCHVRFRKDQNETGKPISLFTLGTKFVLLPLSALVCAQRVLTQLLDLLKRVVVVS